MKRKQVMAFLLAISLAVGNAAISMPAAVWADEVSADPQVSSDDVKKVEDALWTNKDTITLETSAEGATLGASQEDAEKTGGEAQTSAEVSVGDTESDNVTYWYKGQSDTNAAEQKLTVKKDQAAPVISALTVDGTGVLPADDSQKKVIVLKKQPDSIEATATDAEGGIGCAASGAIKYAVETVEKDASEIAAENWKESATLKEGPNYVYVKAVDQLGNASYACSKQIILDTHVVEGTLTLGEEAPIIAAATYTKPTEEQSYNEEDQLTVVIANPKEEGTGYKTPKYLVTDTALEEADLEKQDWTEYQAPVPVENGKYIYARFEDEAGNISYAVTKKMVAVTVPGFKVNIEADGSDNLVFVDGESGIYDLKAGDAPTVKVTAANDGSLDGWKVYYKDLTSNGGSDAYAEMTGASLKVSTKGPHEIECYIEKDGLTSEKQTICFTNMVDPAITFSAPTAQDYTGKPADTTALGATNTAGAEITYEFYSDENATEKIGVPANAGTYYVKAFVAKNIEEGVLAGSSKAVAFTINPAAEGKVTYSDLVTEQYVSNGTSATIDLSGLVADYMISGDSASYSVDTKAGSDSDLIDSAAVDADGMFTFTFADGKTASGDTDTAFTISVAGLNNYTKLTITVNAKITEKEVVKLTIDQNDFAYNGEAAALKVLLGDGTEADAAKLTVTKFTKEGASTVSEAKDAGTYTYEVKYEDAGVVGYASKTFTISKKEIEFKASDVTITKGDALPAAYAFTPAADECLLDGATWAVEPSASCAAADKDTVGTYTITMNAGSVSGSAADNYAITAVDGTLTVKEAAENPSTPSGPSYGGGGGTVTPPSDDKGDQDDTPTTPSDSAISNTVVKDVTVSAEGTVTDKDGKPVANAIVETADGQSFITGADGKVLTDQVVTTENGNKYIVAKDGAVVKSATISVDGAKYLAAADGIVATDGFYETPKGNLVYARADGTLVTNKVFKAGSKKYVAKKNGAIVKSAFSKTAKGNTVYSGKSGSIVTNKAFKVNGKTYVAKKTGALVKNAWVKIGNKKYYCDKNGVVTKTKKVK